VPSGTPIAKCEECARASVLSMVGMTVAEQYSSGDFVERQKKPPHC
jgi:hypothetical protein